MVKKVWMSGDNKVTATRAKDIIIQRKEFEKRNLDFQLSHKDDVEERRIISNRGKILSSHLLKLYQQNY